MPLTNKEVEVAQAYAAKAEAGDPQAIHFWADLESQVRTGHPNAERAQEYLNARTHGLAETKSGVKIDATSLKGLGLGPQQMKDIKAMAERWIDGDEAAIAFFNGCEAGKAQGAMASANALKLRDIVVEAHGRRVPERTIETGGVTASTTPNAHPTAGPNFAHGVPVQPIVASSGIVDSLPPLTPQGIDMVRDAILQKRIFSANVVQDLLNQIIVLRTPVLTAPPSPVDAVSNGGAHLE